MTASPPLVLAAHGSPDPRFADVVDAIASLVAALRADLDVRIGYLEHGPPDLTLVAEPGCVVVPMLLSTGHHVVTDIPAQAAHAVVTTPLGPDPRLTTVLARRLREAGWNGQGPVALAAAGSRDPQALDDVRVAARDLGGVLGVGVLATFLSAGEPRLADVEVPVVSAYLLAPGHFSDLAERSGAAIVSAPLGADPLIAEIVVDRYRAATDADRFDRMTP